MAQTGRQQQTKPFSMPVTIMEKWFTVWSRVENSAILHVWIMAVITQPPLDDGDQAHMSVVRSHPLLAPVMHGNWVYWPLGRNSGRRVREERAPSLRQRALSSSCVQSAGGTNESVELEQLAPNTFCIVKLEIESPIIKWHTLATKSPHQNKLKISISACYLLLEVYNEYPRGWILSISSDYLHLRQRW